MRAVLFCVFGNSVERGVDGVVKFVADTDTLNWPEQY